MIRWIVELIVKFIIVILTISYIIGLPIGFLGYGGHNRMDLAIIFAVIYSVVMIGSIFLLNKLLKKIQFPE